MSKLEYVTIVKTRLKDEGFDPKFDSEDMDFVSFAYENRTEITPSIAADSIINYRTKKAQDREVTVERVINNPAIPSESNTQIWSPSEENATEIYRQADIIEA